ncbi:unnamed protein product [Cuscuta campestris]|uniref:Uncharacterized protein n=1 Tax=Cuscuta campestris TaxID=132261 RepID=A0A484LH40_9ASTE|nr:unnamed protein product [Cuscuta campestris]
MKDMRNMLNLLIFHKGDSQIHQVPALHQIKMIAAWGIIIGAVLTCGAVTLLLLRRRCYWKELMNLNYRDVAISAAVSATASVRDK